jgi:hypothetical protein
MTAIKVVSEAQLLRDLSAVVGLNLEPVAA